MINIDLGIIKIKMSFEEALALGYILAIGAAARNIKIKQLSGKEERV